MEKTKRQSGIELLRILIMLQIIFLHLCAYGNLTDFAHAHGGLTSAAFDGAWAMCRMPVDVFILIMGYFMVTSEFNLQKVFDRGRKVYLTMFFYSVVLATIHFALMPETITASGVFRAFMPFFSREWYFLSNYLIILALSPFLNIVLQKLTKKQYRILLGIVFTVVSVWATLAYIGGLDQVFSIHQIIDKYSGKSLVGLLLMYIIGGYLRRFTEGHNKPQLIYLVWFAALCVTDFLLYRLVPQYGVDVFGMYNNPLVIGEAVAIFLFFRDLHFYSPFVNIVAGTTLGVYAIHENSYVRDMIWQIRFTEDGFMNQKVPGGYVVAFVYCIAIFAVCCLLELLRQKLFDGIARIYQKNKSKKSLHA